MLGFKVLFIYVYLHIFEVVFMFFRLRKFSLVALSLFLPLFLTACSGEDAEQGGGAPPPAEVDVSLPLKKKITEWDDYIGRFQAIKRVDVRSRVTGYLTEKRFKDGQMVKKGDVLFVIDQRPFQYELNRIQAQYSLAQKEYARTNKLRETRAISEQDFDQRLQELKVAEAALDEARLNFEFTEVKSPIDGKVSADFINVGNLVVQNDTILTRVVSVNPIHFLFDASQAELLKYIRLDRQGKRSASTDTANPVFIKLADSEEYTHWGRMDFVDNVVDEGTGTIQGRALVENSDKIIYPGLFGRLRLIASDEGYEALLVPERALNSDQDRKFLYFVDDENKVQRAYVKLGPLLDNGYLVVREGLKGDERVVVSGIQRIRMPQQVVLPVAVELEWREQNSNMPDVSIIPTLEEMISSPKERAPAVSE